MRLDPGLAFGTGTHPTTRMCLKWIAQNAAALQGQRVLDYGCGSGILAIGAALFGSGQIDAVDIDPAAVDATEANAEVNLAHLKNAEGKTRSTPACPIWSEEAQGSYPVVLANILATPLKMLSPCWQAMYSRAAIWFWLASWLARKMNLKKICTRRWACS